MTQERDNKGAVLISALLPYRNTSWLPDSLCSSEAVRRYAVRHIQKGWRPKRPSRDARRRYEAEDALLEGIEDPWFPEPPLNQSRHARDRYNLLARTAQAVCFECPVREQCLKDAESRDERWGIWGGVDFYRLHNPSKREDERMAS